MTTKPKERGPVFYRGDKSKRWIRVQRGTDGYYTAAVSTNTDKPRPHRFNGRNVLGRYRTEQEAVDAASVVLEMEDEKRICTPRDIDRVRKEFAAKGCGETDGKP